MRWSLRADSIKSVWISYNERTRSLEELKESDDPKTRSKTSNLLARVKSFEFLIYVDVHKKCYDKDKDFDK